MLKALELYWQRCMVFPKDAPARAQALNIAESFICEAPAGSGKTELLTQRILALLAEVPEPEAILAITFTRKAAAEMQERLLRALAAAQHPRPEAPHAQRTWELACAALQQDAKQRWHLLANPNRLEIRTFDSFCAKLVQAMPMQSAFGKQLQVQPDAAPLYTAAISAFLKGLDESASWAAPLQHLLAHLDNNAQQLQDLLFQLLATRDAWLERVIALRGQNTGASGALRQQLEQHLQQAIRGHLVLLKQAVPTPVLNALAPLAIKAACTLKSQGEDCALVACSALMDNPAGLGTSLRDLPLWLGLRELLQTQTGSWRKSFTKNQGFPQGTTKDEKAAVKADKEILQHLCEQLSEISGLEDLFFNLLTLPAPRYTDQEWQALGVIVDLLPLVVAHLHQAFAQQGAVDFIEVAQRALMALGDNEAPTDLALRLDYNIRHILVDEFQDTSACQYHLLKKLTETWLPQDGRTLFCVGDAMQSIYSFRAAEVGLFLYAKAHGLGHLPLQPLQLTTNFRSSPCVVDWNNAVFKRVFPAVHNHTTGAVAFSASSAFNAPDASAAVALFAFSGDQAAVQELNTVVQLAQQHFSQTPSQSLAILVKNKRQGCVVVNALQQAQLKPMAIDMASLASHPMVQDCLSLARALLNPADAIAFLAVLRAPWLGLTLQDLLILRQNPGATVIEQLKALLACPEALATLTPHAQIRLPRVAGVLFKALHLRARKPFRLWLEGIWLELAGPACLQCPNDLQAMQDFWQALETLGDTTYWPSIVDVEACIQQLFAAPDTDANPLLSVMTIHKSKGLEFDAVILPQLATASKSSGLALMLWQTQLNAHQQEELLISPVAQTGKDSRIYGYLAKCRTQREAYEASRVMYVATTRAKHRLYLLTTLKHSATDGRVLAPKKGSGLQALWDGTAHLWPAPTDAPAPASPPESAAAPAAPLQRLPSHWQPPARAQGQVLAPYIAPYQFNNQASQHLLRPDNRLARLVGVAVHALLREMADLSIQVWQQTPLAQRRPAWQAHFKTLGLLPSELPSAMQQLDTCVQRILADERLNRLLANPPYCRSEWPIHWQKGAHLIALQIDLLWQPEGQGAVLVDYKTAQPGPKEPLDAFLQQQRALYQPQMAQYQQALRAMDIPVVRAGLYFVNMGLWLEWELLEAC